MNTHRLPSARRNSLREEETQEKSTGNRYSSASHILLGCVCMTRVGGGYFLRVEVGARWGARKAWRLSIGYCNFHSGFGNVTPYPARWTATCSGSALNLLACGTSSASLSAQLSPNLRRQLVGRLSAATSRLLCSYAISKVQTSTLFSSPLKIIIIRQRAANYIDSFEPQPLFRTKTIISKSSVWGGVSGPWKPT